MGKVVLISCVSKKADKKCNARSMYLSPLFKYSLRYAESLNPDKIYILSAEYGLVELDDKIEPYNKTLNNMHKSEMKRWAERVIVQLKNKTDLEKDDFIFLAGEKYRRYLLSHIKNYKLPMEGLSIGRQLSWLKRKIENE